MKKICEGEYGWLYSYGEVFINEGHTELTGLIEKVLREGTYSVEDSHPEPIPRHDAFSGLYDEEFYSKCEAILNKDRELDRGSVGQSELIGASLFFA